MAKPIHVVKDIFSIIFEYHPKENNDTLANRMCVSPEQLKIFYEKNEAPTEKIFELITSFYNDGKASNIKPFISNKFLRRFLEWYLPERNIVQQKTSEEWDDFCDKISSNRFDGIDFLQACETVDVEREVDLNLL